MSNSQNKPKSLQDILKQRQQSGFVGREDQVKQFRHNLELPIEDDRRRFLFNIWGQGGVGKTTLLRQFRKIAEEAKIITAYIDEAEKSVPQVMNRLAEELERQGHKLAQFTERYKVYRQKCLELETDPEAPQGFSAFVGKTVVKAGVRLGRGIPVGGAVFDFVDEDAVATQAGEWASYVAKKLTNNNEILLVQEPVEVLTPLFLQDISKVAEKIGVALFFDTYERTGEFLDNWLQEIIQGHYGAVSLNILITITGRQELDRNYWTPYEGLIVRFPLEPFTEEEAQLYLTRKGITNSRVIEVILRLAGNLPLLVAMLADAHPNDPNQVVEPSSNAVERFLKWIDEPKRRQVALDAAIPRCLNRDIVAQLRGEEEADALFSWLKETSFVNERTDGWAYHDVVKMQMLRHKRLSSPQGWADLHSKLANYYDRLGHELQLKEVKAWQDKTWQSHKLNVLYHRLCQSPQKHLPLALNEFLAALKNQRAFAQDWATTMCQAGKDADYGEVQRWGEKLTNWLKAYEEKRYSAAPEMLTTLLSDASLEDKWRVVALDWRSYIYSQSHQYSKALEDLTEAIKLAPEKAEYLTVRGETYCYIQCYDEALQDFNRAIELDSNYRWAIASRGVTYRLMHRYNQALQDLNRAIELDPDDQWVLAHRGVTYCWMQRYNESLQDLNRAIELDPNYQWAIASRGDTYRRMQRYNESLQDLNRAIELNTNYQWTPATGFRGFIYRQMQRYNEAPQGLDGNIEFNPNYQWVLARRGFIYRQMQRYNEALQDLGRAVELDPKDHWSLKNRGYTYLILQQYNEALVDFNHAINLKCNDDKYLYARALAYQTLNQADKARADLAVAIKLAKQHYEQDHQDWHNTFNLALYYLAAQYTQPVEKLYRYALSQGASLEGIRAAIQDLNDFLNVFPENVSAQYMRQLLQSSQT
ncbi:tetratricopeptide repeat protein [Cylindrospermum sp. FACHB-282]|uniref:tetratricopeptide repeat protein n=1 Tax=Cylindrospermum sp. FACHB-282 TaxID=2692794 RepID=UPI0016895B50|nr:tetratricopeptide repeat protein [Cylindrospermum sp. FACHB-282]MBD2383901.1 tetratricopeptide repeat protein [Cylindrospermum sp. FACHB-282]